MLDTDHQWISNKIRPAPPSSAIPSVPKVRSYFCHISDTPPFVPVPLDLKLRHDIVKAHHDTPLAGHPGRWRTTEDRKSVV